MRILITNDDGFEAEGLKALVSALEKDHEVWVIAPDRNRSGVSHGITMYSPVKLVKKAERQYTCSGYPADCAVIGIKGLVKGKIDLVISGINKGANLGTDIDYSGTAAAARQSSMYGIPGIALSLESFDGSWKYSGLCNFVKNNLSSLLTLCQKDIFININAASLDSYKGVRFACPAVRLYNDKVSFVDGPDGNCYSFLIGGNVQSEGDLDADAKVVEDGYISISKIYSQPKCENIDHSVQEKLCLKI